MSRVISHSQVHTRVRHSCWGCMVSFPAGTDMHRVVSKDGGLLTTYWCLPCQELLNKIAKEDPAAADDGWMRGELAEYVREENRT